MFNKCASWAHTSLVQDRRTSQGIRKGSASQKLQGKGELQRDLVVDAGLEGRVMTAGGPFRMENKGKGPRVRCTRIRWLLQGRRQRRRDQKAVAELKVAQAKGKAKAKRKAKARRRIRKPLQD